MDVFAVSVTGVVAFFLAAYIAHDMLMRRWGR
jgi:hypothetical protein